MVVYSGRWQRKPSNCSDSSWHCSYKHESYRTALDYVTETQGYKVDVHDGSPKVSLDPHYGEKYSFVPMVNHKLNMPTFEIKKDHEYYFIGASHIRFYYDAVVKQFLGQDALKGLTRIHNVLSIQNMHLYSKG